MADRRRSKKGLRRRLFPARQGLLSDDLEITIDDRDRPWRQVAPDQLPHEPGDAYLLMEVITLLRFGETRLADVGLPAGTLLVGPHDDDLAAEALWDNCLTEAQPRSNELDASLERVLGVHPRLESRSRGVPALGVWLRTRFGIVHDRLSSDPLVWEVSTPLGAFQALIDAGRFGPDLAAEIRSTTIQRLLERLRIDVWSDRTTDPDRAALLRKHIAEIEDLDVALFRLSREISDRPFTRDQLERAGLLGRVGA